MWLEGPGVIVNCISCEEMTSIFLAVGEESEEDTDYSEGDDEDFAMEKRKTKRNKKKTKQKMPAEREKKTPKSKINATGKFVLQIWNRLLYYKVPLIFIEGIDKFGRQADCRVMMKMTDCTVEWGE